jgi:hypothetical protein
VEVLPSHPIPLVGLGNGAVTCEHGERHGGIVPQKEPYFLTPIHGFRHWEVEVRIDTMPRLDMDDHATQNSRFHIRALWEPDVKEVVPKVEVGINSHVGLTQSHKGCDMQDPRGGQMVHSRP